MLRHLGRKTMITIELKTFAFIGGVAMFSLLANIITICVILWKRNPNSPIRHAIEDFIFEEEDDED